MGRRQASLSTIPLFFIGALLMLACAHETWASPIEIESEPEYDESSANPFERFLLDSRTGGAATCKATSKRCRKSGGVCVEAGTCKTMEIPGSSCSKIGNFKTDNCTCCAKDMSKVCKPKKSCKDLGGFCVVNPKACRGEAILIKGGCNCKGWSGRGSCCKPIVLCDELVCGANETCITSTHTETNITFGQCICADGFVRHDGQCVVPCDLLKCHVRETCINSTDTETNKPVGKCVCAHGFIRRDGKCIVGGVVSDQTFIFNFEKANWNDARSQCESKGQRLANINDMQGLIDFVEGDYAFDHAYVEYYNRYQTFDKDLSTYEHFWWVGGSDADTEDTWVWTDGTAIADDIKWSTYESHSNTEEKDCMTVDYDYFYPYDCSRSNYYICVEE